MKDSSKLLSFNVNRNLNFKVFRGVSFDVRRNLAFDLNRDLFFDLDRDLGFGKRGVVFRGYVCPICGAPVAKDASNCDECGVQFEQTVKEKPKKEVNKWDRGERDNTPPKRSPPKKSTPSKSAKKSTPKSPSHSKSASPQRSTFQCPICGKLLYVGTSKCPGCDVAFNSHQKTPARSQPKTSERAAAPGIVYCTNCNYKIPPIDKFCRRCGSAKPYGTGSGTVSWQEFQSKEKKDGLVSWDEYSGRN